jgi:hypothetical protein
MYRARATGTPGPAGPTGPTGPPGSGVIDREIAVGATDSVNLIFTTSHTYQAGTIAVYLNGLRQLPGIDYTETSTTTFSMIAAPYPGDVLFVEYLEL